MTIKDTEGKIDASKIRRHGNCIILGDGYTAVEGKDRGMNTLRIRKDGKDVTTYRGSSIGFSNPLTDEDKRYLAMLSENA